MRSNSRHPAGVRSGAVTLLGCGRARSGGLGGLPAGHLEQRERSQFPTKPAPVVDESLVNLTRMYPVVDVQLRLDEMLLPLSDASSEPDSHDVALFDDEQLYMTTLSLPDSVSNCENEMEMLLPTLLMTHEQSSPLL